MDRNIAVGNDEGIPEAIRDGAAGRGLALCFAEL